MNKYIVLLSVLILSLSVRADEISIIRDKYIHSILYANEFENQLISSLKKHPVEPVIGDQMIIELMERYPIKESYIHQLVNDLRADGSWPDIDFSNMAAAGWPPKNHAARILDLAKVYRNPTHSMYQSEEISEAIHRAMNYWFNVKPIAVNWWYNDIGIPKVLGAVFVLFEDQMTPLEKEAAIQVMSQSKIGMTAQNKVWLAGNVLVRGLLLNDLKLIQQARDAINSEIKLAYGKSEGIKVDHSFHQHGPQQQSGNYGAAYLATISFWAYVLGDTSLSLEQERFKIISDLTNLGFRRVLWHNVMDVNCMGRQFYVNAQRHKSFSVLFSANTLAQADKTNRPVYESLIEENMSDSSVGLLGQYHYWKSDMTVHRQPKWMASVKMASERVIGTEGGAENVKGYYVADGATYTYVDGKEYENIFPCWDWRKVPGVTCYQSDNVLPVMTWLEKQNLGTFVGNVNDGEIGITSMELSRDGLTGKKAWIFTPDYVLCLGAGIASDSIYPVTTSVEQALRKSDLLYFNQKKWNKITELDFSSKTPQRFFHNQTGYIILEGNGKAFAEQRTNSWNEIMRLYPKDMMETQNVFSLYINHNSQPTHGSYQYVLLPAKTQKQVESFDVSSFNVIHNTSKNQVVQTDKNTFLLAMHEKGKISLSKKLKFECSAPGLFILKIDKQDWEVTASDPTQKEETIEISVNNDRRTILLPGGEYRGTPVKVDNKQPAALEGKTSSLKNIVEQALQTAEQQSLAMAKKYMDQEGTLPRTFQNGKDVSSDSRWWCSGFFPGVLWYLYEYNKNPEILKYAQLYTDRVEREKYTTDNHDVGFMLYCSFGNGFRLTKNKRYKEVLLTGAKSLATRYKPNVGLIRSWDHNQSNWQYPVIIDNMMNLELLLWAAKNSKDPYFKEISISHANKTLKHHFRPDYSSYHVVSYDTISGLPHKKQTHQGYSNESAWARGQGWGLYGFTYMYRETKDIQYLDMAKHIADFIINHPRMPKDYIPYWDFDSPDIPNTLRDASAATLIASALIELADYVEPELAKKYMQVVETQIRTLASPQYTAEIGTNGDFILKHSVGALPLKSEVDVPLTYTDYYYLEALIRLKRQWK